MKALITGASGTVGAVLAASLRAQGQEVVAWDRAAVPVDDTDAMERFLHEVRPDVLYHLATASQPTGRDNEGWLVNVEWPRTLARLSRALGSRMVFTSSVMVFTDAAAGPFTPASPPDAQEGYGFEKRMAEEAVLAEYPEAIVARLGWQIGEQPGSNQMLDFLARQMREQGVIRASERWLPACSFLRDTADALRALSQGPGGLYLLDANERWSFYEIVRALNAHHGAHWQIIATEDFVYDQRMLDPRVPLRSLRETLSALP